jgi:hypothetical protein
MECFTNFNFLRGTNYMVPFNDLIHIRFFNVKNIPTHYSIQTREIKVNRLNIRTQNKTEHFQSLKIKNEFFKV